MRAATLATACTVAIVGAASADGNDVCNAMYDRIAAGYDINFQQCKMGIPSFDLKECTPPHDFAGGLPTSHLILALDVSGSMAGKAGGETKMRIAQREALSFLDELSTDVSVGLMLYGHKGNNKESGKAESCASPEMVHSFNSSRSEMRNTIQSLTPTGWTPLGGTLSAAADILNGLPNEGESLKPVVYLISDGEETCDSGPIEAAKRLASDGIQATVNTIGFAVDNETQQQLKAIADAGLGTYYPAQNAAALNAVLSGIREAEGSHHRFNLCVNSNAAQISGAHQRAARDFQFCAREYDPTPLQTALHNAVENAKAEGLPEKDCLFPVLDRLEQDLAGVTYGFWLNDQVSGMVSEGNAAARDYVISNGLKPNF